MAAVLMMSAKLATLGLLKVEVFSNKGYNAIKKTSNLYFIRIWPEKRDTLGSGSITATRYSENGIEETCK